MKIKIIPNTFPDYNGMIPEINNRINTKFSHILPKIEEKRMLLNSFYKRSIIVISKPSKNKTTDQFPFEYRHKLSTKH